MAFAMQFTVLWLMTLAFLVQPNSSATQYNGTVTFIQSLTSILPDGGLSPGLQSSHVASTFSITDEHTVSPVDHPTHRSLGLRNHHAVHLGLHKSRRDGGAPRQKCTEAPMTRKIAYYQAYVPLPSHGSTVWKHSILNRYTDCRSNLRERLCNRITPAQINTNGLTHLYFSHVDMNRDNFSIVPAHPGDVTLYHDFVTLKTSSMQTWVAVGGREFNSEIWKLMTSRNDWRRMFITSIADFMKHYGFQGVDLSWQFPSAPDDASNFVALVREMRSSWAKQYGISVTLPPSPQYLRGFDPKGMEPYVDFFGYMSWDIQGLAEVTIRAHTDMAVIQNDTTALWAAHLDPHKVNFGLANYGHGYTLRDTNCHTAGCPFTGRSKPAPCTNAVGFISETEINALIKDRSLKPAFANLMAKQITWDDQWIGYDDDETRAQKIAWAAQQCFGGTITWSVDLASGEGR